MDEPNNIVGVDSVDLARQVIRSLRCKSASQQRYLVNDQQFQSQPYGNVNSNAQYLALHAKDLNKIIEIETKEQNKKLLRLQQINDAIERYDGGAAILSSEQPSKDSVQTMWSSNKVQLKSAANDDSEEFDGDDDVSSSKSTGKKATSLRNAIKSGRLQSEKAFVNRCDYDAVDNNRYVSSSNNMADDFDIGSDDDDEGMKELFKDFVAPTNKAGKTLSSQSSVTKTKVSQHGDILQTSMKRGVTIKPGQAIRVKPKGKKSSSDMS